MTPSKPIVSVIMPVYNSERYLKEAIESILNQSFRDFEFLIFDDGSKDKSKEIIQEYAILDSRIKPYYTAKNLGYVVHLNKGLDLAKGDYIARMDSDDISEPDRLKLQLEQMIKNPNIGALGTSTIVIDELGKLIGKVQRETSSSFLFWQSFFTNPFAHPTVMFKKQLVLDVNGYDINKIPAEDYDLWVRIISKVDIANLEYPLVRYRIHSKSISNQKRKTQIRNSTETLRYHWKNQLCISINEEETIFLKNFHKGYDDLNPSCAYLIFKKLNILLCQVLNRYGHIHDKVATDYIHKQVYLLTKVKRYSLSKAIFILIYLVTNYPTSVLKYLINGRT